MMIAQRSALSARSIATPKATRRSAVVAAAADRKMWYVDATR